VALLVFLSLHCCQWFWGATATYFVLDDNELGLLASAYFGSYAVVTFSSAFWVRDINWRILAMLSMSMMAVSITAILVFKSL
jgi:hypothetical protein